MVGAPLLQDENFPFFRGEPLVFSHIKQSPSCCVIAERISPGHNTFPFHFGIVCKGDRFHQLSTNAAVRTGTALLCSSAAWVDVCFCRVYGSATLVDVTTEVLYTAWEFVIQVFEVNT